MRLRLAARVTLINEIMAPRPTYPRTKVSNVSRRGVGGYLRSFALHAFVPFCRVAYLLSPRYLSRHVPLVTRARPPSLPSSIIEFKASPLPTPLLLPPSFSLPPFPTEFSREKLDRIRYDSVRRFSRRSRSEIRYRALRDAIFARFVNPRDPTDRRIYPIPPDELFNTSAADVSTFLPSSSSV